MNPELAAAKPRVSLVVPMRDEEGTISKLICSILGQKLTPDEVILVDAGSQDRTVSLARELIESDARFHILEVGPAWPGKARNLGVRAASCEWIAFTDAGISLDPQWLRELAKAMEQNEATDVVYGNVDPKIENLLDRCATLLYVAPKFLANNTAMRGPFIASSLIRKSILEAVGGFPDFRAAEDLILMEKIKDTGCKIVWQPLATVEWNLPPTLFKTFARFRLYSRHNIYAGWQRHWHYGVLRFYVAAAVLALALTLLNWRWSLLVFPLGIAARVAKAIWLRRKDWRPQHLLNPMQFLLMMVLLIVLDAATFAGWIEAGMDRLFKREFFAVNNQSNATGKAKE